VVNNRKWTGGMALTGSGLLSRRALGGLATGLAVSLGLDAGAGAKKKKK
jgi:hypothetical protein